MNIRWWHRQAAWLDEILDRKPVGAQQPNPVSMTKVELDRWTTLPLKAVHPELRAKQAVADCPRRSRHQVRRASITCCCLGKRAHRRSAAGQPRDPQVRIGPDGGAVLADEEIEGPVSQRNLFTRGAQQRKPEAELILHPPGDAQLAGARIDADRLSTSARHPRGNVGGSASKLEGRDALQVPRKDPYGLLADSKDAPRRLIGRPLAPGQLQLIIVARFPGLDIGLPRESKRPTVTVVYVGNDDGGLDLRSRHKPRFKPQRGLEENEPLTRGGTPESASDQHKRCKKDNGGLHGTVFKPSPRCHIVPSKGPYSRENQWIALFRSAPSLELSNGDVGSFTTTGRSARPIKHRKQGCVIHDDSGASAC